MPRRSGVVAAVAALACPALLAGCQGEPPALPGPYGREVARAIPLVEQAVGLRFKTPPKVQTRDRSELRAVLKEKFDEAQPALETAGEERAYKLLGLLPDTLDLRAFLLSLLSEQVVGYYDPSTKVLYVIGDTAGAGAPQPEILNVTITHELVHALQDQYLSLDSLTKARNADNDAAMAAQALIEGQATFEQLNIMLGGGGKMVATMPGGWDRVRQMIRDSQGAMPILGAAPMFIQETLLFPYLSGAEYVRAFAERRPGQSPLTAIPASTEQILHPAKNIDSLDAPVRLTLPRPIAGSVVYENGLGEFETRLMLHQQLRDVATASRGASGWGGDRYMVVNTPGGAGITWLSVWDNPFEAGEFRFILANSVEKRFGVSDPQGAAGENLRYAARGRTIEIAAVTVQGRPGVLYTDVPAGTPVRLIDVGKVRIGPSR
ncbi:MAG TPA: hypothetical protein VG916_08885 [Gemmatimonadaceae bacterium]|nr:hypothetical protein [Gemmatimonadaceae bacterium]